MKISTKRRLLSLLLSLVMILTLAPTALLEGNDQEPGDEEEVPPGTITDLYLDCDTWDAGETAYSLTLEPNSSANQGARIEVSWDPVNPTTEDLRIVWKSNDPEVAAISEQDNGRVANIYGVNPGATEVTVSVGGIEETILVTVSGIKLLTTEITVLENQSERVALGVDYELYGHAASPEGKLTVSVVNNKPNIYAFATGGLVTVEGRQAGDATLVLTMAAGGYTYTAEIHVIVNSNVAIIPWNEPVSPSKPLKFSELEKLIADECLAQTGLTLTSIIGLTVPTSQGILYLGYKSPDDTGAGVGSAVAYYYNANRGPYIRDITFVPNAFYTGEKAQITFTGQAAEGSGGLRTFKGRIDVTLEDVQTDLTLTTRADVPLKLSAADFAKVCQEQTGGSLSYVIFTLPPASQGVLFRDYKNALDYGSHVTATEEYDRKDLDDITFVPTEGYVGTVTIGYAGYSTTGGKYTGELVINVTRALDESIQYQDYGSGSVTFSGGDFDDYSLAKTGQPMRTAGWVSFTLPPASQGELYYRRNSTRGTPVRAEDKWSLTQLNYIVFEAANDFSDVVRIPFVGQDRNGTEFSGTVELHIQTNSVRNGDISYTCQPGQSVKLQVSDFSNLCQSVLSDKLYYVTFQALPDYTQGSLFYNRTSSGVIGTRVTTASKYFNSATPYLNNVSFWAAQNFKSVEIPFTLASVSGKTLTGLLVISDGTGAGNGRPGVVSYATSGQQPVTFSASGFDAACRQATNSALQYLRLNLPGSGQGILYYGYREGATPQAFDPNTTLYLTGGTSIDQVTFVPAAGFSGVAYMTYTGTAINGTTFQGTVEVTVRAGAAFNGIVHYSTGGAPVRLQSYDLIAASGIGQPSSIRLTGLPSADQGRVYYQYTSPTQYSWQGNTTTSYSVTGDPSVSNLTFIPKAGYQGVVTISYAATAYDGTTSQGTVEITVTLPSTSGSFDDMDGYSAQVKSAVDYLSSQGVVNGTSYRIYEPGASILRGDFCLMLSRAFRFSVSAGSSGFSDVPFNAYYTQAVNEMYALGVVNGVGGGRFEPTQTISRQDAAVMVCRALNKAGLPLPDGSDQAALANYKDRGRVDSYAQTAVGSLVRAGIFPVSGDTLDPRADITRADMALLLHRAMTNFS